MEQVYKCLCGGTKTITRASHQTVLDFLNNLPQKVPCGWRGCESYAMPYPRFLRDRISPEAVLVEAKLAGTKMEVNLKDKGEFGYIFRTNEQAAALAIQALYDAGFEINRKEDAEEIESGFYCITHRKMVKHFKDPCETGRELDEACLVRAR